MDFTIEDVKQIMEDARYLQDEIEALKYVIHDVPYDDKPADGEYSILEMVGMIDHAQVAFYRPAMEEIIKHPAPEVSVSTDYESSFKLRKDENDTVDTILNRIIKHRAAFLNFMSKIKPLEWERSGFIGGKRRSVYSLLNELVNFERDQLKKVAERVMTLNRN
jgi:hypothetical protein